MLALAMTITVGISASPAKTVKAAGDVEINETNFPDEHFREILLDRPYGKDGVLTEDEIAGIKDLYVYGNISSRSSEVFLLTSRLVS